MLQTAYSMLCFLLNRWHRGGVDAGTVQHAVVSRLQREARATACGKIVTTVLSKAQHRKGEVETGNLLLSRSSKEGGSRSGRDDDRPPLTHPHTAPAHHAAHVTSGDFKGIDSRLWQDLHDKDDYSVMCC